MSSQIKTKAYWWKGTPNFGDQLTRLILHHFGIETEWSSLAEAEVVVTGSQLDFVPEDWSGIVAGAGFLKPKETKKQDPQQLSIMGVRGELTARRLRRANEDWVIGDPGLLASELVPADREQHEWGVIPHWSDTELVPKFSHLDALVINPRDDPDAVLAQIGSCRKIVSSSLHGIIVADSFGIPRQFEAFPSMAKWREGGKYKFEDHGSAVGVPVRFGELQTAPLNRVEAIQFQLFEMLSELPHVLATKTPTTPHLPPRSFR